MDFLRRTRCEHLYLVGDIIDLESLRRSFYWPPSHNDVMQLLLKMSRDGTKITYIPGNHDNDVRAHVGLTFGSVEIVREAIHTTRTGLRLLVLHGDRFDAVVRGKSIKSRVGAIACRSLLTLDRFTHWLRDRSSRPYWSLARYVKARLAFAQRYVSRFRSACLDAARDAGADGIVCGHIHTAEVTEIDDLLYCNDGDWVENCTALVESPAGNLSLLEWRPSAASVRRPARLATPAWGDTSLRTPSSVEIDPEYSG